MALAVIAVDFGASSIRVCRVDLDARPLVPQVVHRYAHAPVPDVAGTLRWDWARLVAEMQHGLERALEIGPAASIGIDTWGVDYGLVDARGELVAPPVSYRDARTRDWRDVAERIGHASLYETTGVQLMPINTLFQLAAHDRTETARAHTLLLLPELLVHELCGAACAEATSAGTSALVDIRSGRWSAELIEAAGADPAWFPEIRRAGTRVGEWRGTPVHLVGGHDTASAVVAMGADPSPRSAFVSAGTWFLVGQERPGPDTGAAARAANFSNEIGTFGGVRFLRNLTGMWLLEGCRRSWGDPPLTALLEAAAAVRDPHPPIDPDDPGLAAPDDMAAALCDLAGLPRDAERGRVARLVVDSIAQGVARIVDALGDVDGITLFGGASRSALLQREIEERAGLAVCRGPVEATALGNALTQGVALGRFADLAEARAALA